MTLRTIASVLVLAILPHRSSAQIPERSIEVYGTAGGVAVITPVHTVGESRVGVHAGFVLDAGIQGERLAMASVLRFWKLAPTRVYGGHGIDVIARAEASG